MSALAPFAVRSFRFQWPADLATSLSFEAEALILGWYILATTGSVELLVLFAALAWGGSLFSPFFGIAGDRFGARNLVLATRAAYAVLALILMLLIVSDALRAWQVFVIYGIAGVMRPSDQAMRSVLVGQTMKPAVLMNALAVSRTTGDLSKVAGALLGTGAVALIGMGPAYVIVTLLYVGAFLLSLGIAPSRRHPSRLRDVAAHLEGAARYIWAKPDQLGAFGIAFIVNLLAFPFFLGLLPYAAKEVFQVGQAGLGYLAAAFALGALSGSIAVGATRARLPAGRTMLLGSAAWFVAILFFGQTRSLPLGLFLALSAGFVQSWCLVPLAAVMLRGASDEMRGRVMGMRMLAIWGLPLGLLASGPLIAHIGYAAVAALYAALGLAATFWIGWRWRAAIWHRGAVANQHA